MTGLSRHRDVDRCDADRDAADKRDNKPSHGKHIRKDHDDGGHDHRDKDGDAKGKDEKMKDGKDARPGRAKKPSRGGFAPEPDGPQSDRQDD